MAREIDAAKSAALADEKANLRKIAADSIAVGSRLTRK